MKELLIALILTLMCSTAFAGKAAQEWVNCGLAVFDSEGNVVDSVAGEGHLVVNKNRVNLNCNAYSETAAELFTNAEKFYSLCFAGGYFDFDMDNLNVTTPSGKVHFNCHIDIED